MPNYVIQLIVNGGAAVTNVNKLTGSLGKATGAARLLNQALAGLGAASMVRGLMKLSDTYTQVQNRLRFVTGGTRELALMTEKTFEIAQKNRVSWEALSTTYARVRKATVSMGLSANDSITIIDRLAKAIKLNGSSTQETTSTIRQFGQALSKGKLNGDEFVSLMENARPVMDLVAKSMGKTHGELFRLAKQGKITGEILAKSLLNPNGKGLDEAASKQLVTFAERWVTLRNAAAKFVGESPSIQGAFKAIGDAIGALVGNFDGAGRAILVVVELLAVGFAVRAVGAVIAGLRALSIAALANPFTAMAVALGALVVLAIEFRKELAGMVKDMGKISHQGEATLNASGRSGVGVGTNKLVQQGSNERLLSQVKEARELVDLFGGLEAARTKAKENFNQDLMDAVELVEKFSADMATAAGRSFQEILNKFKGDIIIDGFVKTMQDMIVKIGKITDDELMNRTGKKQAGPGMTDAELKKIRVEMEKLREKTNNAAKVYYDLRDAQLALNKAIRAGLIDVEGAQIVYDKLHDSIADLNQVTADANVLGAKFGSGGGIPKASMERTDLLLGQDAARTKGQNSDLFKDSLAAQKQILEELRPGEQDRINRLVAMNVLLSKNAISQEQYNKLLKQLTEEEMLSGVKKLDQEFVLLFNNMENALADFLYTGEFGFRKMVDAMLRDISRLLAQQLIMGALGAASGASSGNWISAGAAMMGQKGFASGGSFMVGGNPGTDTNMVAFRATRGERVTVETPGQQARSAKGGGGSANVTLVNPWDPRRMADSLNTPAGQRAMNDAIRKQPSIVTRRTK